MLNIGSPSLCQAEGLSISLSGGALIFPWSSGSLSVAEKYTVRYKGRSSEINLLKMLPCLKRKGLYTLDAQWINVMKIRNGNASLRLRHKFPPETRGREFTKWQDRTLTGQDIDRTVRTFGHTPSYEVRILTESFKLWNYHGQFWMYFRIVGSTVQGTLTDASRAATT